MAAGQTHTRTRAAHAGARGGVAADLAGDAADGAREMVALQRLHVAHLRERGGESGSEWVGELESGV
jgi:hypothetical protein